MVIVAQIKTVEDLINANPDSTIEEKKNLAEAWIELYFQQNGKMPKPLDLTKLADWLLEEELKDVSRSKVQNTEFPFLSKPQIERRYREISMEQDIVDILHKKKMNHSPTRKKATTNSEY
jgi:hypothetical protein